MGQAKRTPKSGGQSVRIFPKVLWQVLVLPIEMFSQKFTIQTINRFTLTNRSIYLRYL